MTLAQIVALNARTVRASHVVIECDSKMGFVSIETREGECIAFLQDSEGYAFIDEAEKIWNEVGTIGVDDARAHVAMPYIESHDF